MNNTINTLRNLSLRAITMNSHVPDHINLNRTRHLLNNASNRNPSTNQIRRLIRRQIIRVRFSLSTSNRQLPLPLNRLSFRHKLPTNRHIRIATKRTKRLPRTTIHQFKTSAIARPSIHIQINSNRRHHKNNLRIRGIKHTDQDTKYRNAVRFRFSEVLPVLNNLHKVMQIKFTQNTRAHRPYNHERNKSISIISSTRNDTPDLCQSDFTDSSTVDIAL